MIRMGCWFVKHRHISLVTRSAFKVIGKKCHENVIYSAEYKKLKIMCTQYVSKFQFQFKDCSSKTRVELIVLLRHVLPHPGPYCANFSTTTDWKCLNAFIFI